MMIAVYSILLLLLLCLSVFFSSADMAFGSVSIGRLEDEKPSKKTRLAIKLSREYDKTISTILLFNDTVNAALDTISTLLGILLAYEWFGVVDPDAQENYGLICSLVFLVLKIIFGEIIAKSLGKVYNRGLVKAYSYIILACYYVTYPITFLVGGFGKVVTYPVTKAVKDYQPSDDELHEMTDEMEEKGAIDEQAADLLRGTIDYATTEAYEIMTPRAKVTAICLEDTLKDIFSDEETFAHSRLPVYEDDFDSIQGYVKSKDLIALHLEGKQLIPQSAVNPVLFIPRTVEINDLFQRMKKEKAQMAVVMDEYGAVEGIITMEDIVEEIVGEIWDETDRADEPIEEAGENEYIVDGAVTLREFCSEFNLDFDSIDTEYDTIGGFIVELLGDRFAKQGDEVTYQNLTLKVLHVEGTAVDKILVKTQEKEKDKE